LIYRYWSDTIFHLLAFCSFYLRRTSENHQIVTDRKKGSPSNTRAPRYELPKSAFEQLEHAPQAASATLVLASASRLSSLICFGVLNKRVLSGSSARMVQAVFCLNGDGTLIYEKDFGGGSFLQTAQLAPCTASIYTAPRDDSSR